MRIKNGDDGFVDPQELLLRTDWNAVEHCCPNVAPATPLILLQLLDEDPRVQGAALRDLNQAVTHQNTFYSATAPAAAFVAAILEDPRTLAEVSDRTPYEDAHYGAQPPFPLRVGLLNWLRDTAEDANHTAEWPPGEQADIDAFRAVRPALFDAARQLLADDSQEVREAALTAILPLLTEPDLAHHIPALRDEVRALAVGDGPHRGRAIDALASWGEDTSLHPRPTRHVGDVWADMAAPDEPPF
ncbi:hypothetical protein ACFV2B_25600 [Streptomyces lavendulae]|uniref:hypothetical protein n=1 Tax=Streptomyces lavendulae TaxID=1914 RepID=UPI0036BD26B2